MDVCDFTTRTGIMLKPLMKFLNIVDAFFDYFLKGNVAFQVMAGITMYMTVYALRHFVDPHYYTFDMASSPFFEIFVINNMLVVAHIGAAMPALIIGPWMFHTKFRDEQLKLHRKLGEIYVIGCIISAATVFPVALANLGGLVAHIGFGSMAFIWFWTTYFAYTAIIHGNVAAHRRWMMRSYAMTFAFVHVNFTYHILIPEIMVTMNPYGLKALQSQVSWLANLFIVEIYLAAVSHKGQFWGFKRWGKTLFTRYNKADKMYFSPKRPAKKG